MRYYIIFVFLLACCVLKSQIGLSQVYQEDTTKYMKNPAAYPSQLRGFWATSIFRLPDTTNNRPQQGVPGAYGRNPAGTQAFIWDGSQWIAGTGGVQVDSIFITNIDSIFITTTDSIFIVSGNDTIYIGNAANGMDTAFTRNDSIIGVKSNIEFLIAVLNASTPTLQPHSPGYGILGSDYNGTSPQTWSVDTSILFNQTLFIDSSQVEFFVDSIANTPTGSEANGIKYLVGTSPTGVFTGHANEIAQLVGGVWTFTIPVAGDDLVVSNETQPTSFYHYDGIIWHFVRRSLSIGGDRIGANIDYGTLDNRPLRAITNGNVRERIDAQGRHYFNKFIGTPTGRYFYPDSATGRLDTAAFTQLVLTTNFSSGASTLNNDTLNIPIYSGGGGITDTFYYNVEWFGAVHDSITDDGPAIQDAVDWINANDPGGVLFFPAGNYRDTSHTHWKSNVNALGTGEKSVIFNDLPTLTRFASQAPIFFGNLTPSSWDSTDLKYFDVSYSSGHKIKIVDSISRFAVGDIVVLRGATFWLNTDGQVRPHVLRIGKVVSKSGDTAMLDESVDTTITKVAISGHYISGSSKRLDAYSQPAIFISNFNISNLKLVSTYGDMFLGGAMYKANFNDVWTEGKESLGGNGEAFCNFNNIKARFSKQAWENSIGTHNTTINNLEATWNGTIDAESNKPLIKFGESVYNVTFNSPKINAGNFPGKGIWFGAATHSGINDLELHAEGIDDELIEFSNTNNVIANKIHGGNVYSANSSKYVKYEKNAGVSARLADNEINDVKFWGNTGATALLLDGTNSTVKDSYFEDGNLSFGDSLVNYKIDNTTITGTYYLSKSNQSSSGIIDITGGLHLTTSAGTGGVDSVLVQSGGIIKRISPTYYGAGSGTVSSIATTSPITGGTITTTGTIALDTTTASGGWHSKNYYDALYVPLSRTVNGKALSSNITLSLASSDFANQGTTTTVLHGNAAGNPSFSAIGLTTDVTGTLPIANGGTNNGSLSVTAGSIYYGDGSKINAIAAGTTGQVLIGGTTPSWSTNQFFDTSKAYIWTPPSAHIFQINNLTTTTTNGIILRDTTVTTSGVQNQYPPALMFEGRHWTGSVSAKDSLQIVYKVSGNSTLDFLFNGVSNKIQFTATPSLLVGNNTSIFGSAVQSTTLTGSTVNSSANNTTVTLQDRAYTNGATIGINALTGNVTNTSGAWTGLKIAPTINQASGSGTNDVFLINPTLTNVQSGGTTLLRVQTGGTDRFIVNKDGMTTITRPLATSGSTPSNSAGTGAGTGPTISVTGNDIAGRVSIATGTSPTAGGDVVTITFATALTNTPTSIILTAANANAAGEIAKIYVDQSSVSTSSFKIKNTSSALTASTTYLFYYSVYQ